MHLLCMSSIKGLRERKSSLGKSVEIHRLNEQEVELIQKKPFV